MKFAAVVILYNPDDNVVENILSYSEKADVVYVFDNSEKIKINIVNEIRNIRNVTYFGDAINWGISKRLNEAAAKAISEGYDWLLTMDQDSRFAQDELSNYCESINLFTTKELVAMFGVEFEKEHVVDNQEKALSKDYLITSGSFLNLKLYPVVGTFDEALFIDEVDLEYCYRAITKGFTIIQFTNIFLKHHLGTVALFRSLKSGKLTPRTLHSPLRIYYMVRNFLYVSDLYKGRFPESTSIRRKTLFNRLKNNLIYGKDRLILVKMVVKSLKDYKKGKMGKFE